MAVLSGRRIVVTGAGRGIGAAIAELSASEGALVVVNDLGTTVDGTGRDQASPADEVVARISSSGGAALAHRADVSASEQAEDLVETAIREFGGIDVLINTAGILRDKMIFNMEPEEWEAVQQVHLRGTFNTTRIASRYWRKERAGDYRLINTTSIAGLYGAPGQPNYAAAKLGIVGFTYSCANALMRYGVTANALCPGALTRMAGGLSGADGLAGDDLSVLTAENVAPAVVYVASLASGWMTGQVFGAMGRSISLYSRPVIVREIVTTGDGWRVDDVFARFEAAFRPVIDGTENPYEATVRSTLAGPAGPASSTSGV
jgi:NAD(P)-dependent dehydrogenase (short-subunit alcohol dehydrogenase family)